MGSLRLTQYLPSGVYRCPTRPLLGLMKTGLFFQKNSSRERWCNVMRCEWKPNADESSNHIVVCVRWFACYVRKVYSRSGQVRYGGIRRSCESLRPSCDGTPSSSVWPSPRQTSGPSCSFSLERPPSGHLPDRRQARHAHFLQKGLRLAIAQADARPAMPVSIR